MDIIALNKDLLLKAYLSLHYASTCFYFDSTYDYFVSSAIRPFNLCNFAVNSAVVLLPWFLFNHWLNRTICLTRPLHAFCELIALPVDVFGPVLDCQGCHSLIISDCFAFCASVHFLAAIVFCLNLFFALTNSLICKIADFSGFTVAFAFTMAVKASPAMALGVHNVLLFKTVFGVQIHAYDFLYSVRNWFNLDTIYSYSELENFLFDQNSFIVFAR